MASKRFAPGTEENMIFNDFYKMAQDYFIPEDKPQYWDNVLIAIKLFMKKYEKNSFAIELSFALWNVLMSTKQTNQERDRLKKLFTEFCEQQTEGKE